MLESLLSKIREETVQARTQMYDILSLLRRRGVTSGLLAFGYGRCEVMFWVGKEEIFRCISEKYDLLLGDPINMSELLRSVIHIDFPDTKSIHTFIFTEKGIEIRGRDSNGIIRYTPFDISELLFELKFEGMK